MEMHVKRSGLYLTSIILFGPPRDANCSFDIIFKSVTLTKCSTSVSSRTTMSLRKMSRYACPCTTPTLQAVLLQLRSKTSQRNGFHPIRFNNPDVSAFLDAFNNKFKRCINFAMTNFMKYTGPIVPLEVVVNYIDRCPEVFDNVWHLICNIHGVNKKNAWEAGRREVKWVDLFFEFFSLVR